MTASDFTLTFLVDKPSEEIFNEILDVRGWWSGLYAEEIEGAANNLSNEFSFRAGNGAHYSNQQLIELIPGKRIVWLVTDSNLSFLGKRDEWTGTKLCFDLSPQGEKTQVSFTHQGLVPAIECYDSCSGTWPKYLQHLKVKQ